MEKTKRLQYLVGIALAFYCQIKLLEEVEASKSRQKILLDLTEKNLKGQILIREEKEIPDQASFKDYIRKLYLFKFAKGILDKVNN
jgi:hypothetical protein